MEITVVCDVTSEDGRKNQMRLVAWIPVNNAGGPPPGDFRDWTRDTWIAALDANMLTVFALIQAVIDPAIDQKFGRL